MGCSYVSVAVQEIEYLRDNKTQQCFKMASPTGALRFFPVDVKEIVFEWVCMIFGSGAT